MNRKNSFDFKTIELIVKSQVAWITLNRPAALNAISREMLQELTVAIDHVITLVPADVRVLVVTGAGRAFCAGADLQSVSGTTENSCDSMPHAIQSFLSRLRKLPLPVIASINGLAMGGGLELALHCDIIVANESAKIADAHANVGVLPGAGGAAILPRLIGPVFAKYMVFTGETVTAADLYRLGLIAKVFSASELAEGTRTLAERIAQKSPLGLARMKRLIDDGLEQSNLDTALAMELIANELHSHSHDYAEGISAFLEKRQPRFIGK